MRNNKKFVFLLLAALLMAALPMSLIAAGNADEEPAAGTYTMVVEGFDWGPGVTKLILDVNQKVEPAAVKAADFTVDVTKQALDWTTFQPTVAVEPRPILDAYASDEAGARLDEASEYVTLELAVSPEMGNPFYFFIDFSTGAMGNLWADPYTHEIAYKGNAIKYFYINPEPAQKIMPLTDEFNIDGTFTASDGITLQYASFAPAAEEGNKRPLLIWLHGAGEGSVGGIADPTVVLLGNRVTQLANTEIQTALGGAYILAPQSPTMWMDAGTGYTENGDSIYVDALTELITDYIANNPGIDTDRVFIGGCSNGGFMTMKMLLTHPELFAAAYPICEAYRDEWITDEQLAVLMDIPIWFTQAVSDDTVKYDDYALPTFERLYDAKAADAHMSLYQRVLDESGLYMNQAGDTYEYSGHWSWIYTLNNRCAEMIDGERVTIFEWLAEH